MMLTCSFLILFLWNKISVVMTFFLNDPSYENFRARFSAFYELDPIVDLTSPMTFPEANTLQNGVTSVIGRKAFEGSHVYAPLKFSTFKLVLNALLDFDKEHSSEGNSAVLFDFHNNNYDIPSKIG